MQALRVQLVLFSVLLVCEAVVASNADDIACIVCRNACTNAHATVAKQRAKTAGGKLGEDSVLEVVEDICNVKSESGTWLTHLDVVRDSAQHLSVKVHPTPGKCGRECAGLQKVCVETMEPAMAEMGVHLFKNTLAADALADKTCDAVCRTVGKKKKAVYAADFTIDEEFVPVPAETLKADRLMADLRSKGFGGEVYSREELLKKTAALESDQGDDDVPRQANKKPKQSSNTIPPTSVPTSSTQTNQKTSSSSSKKRSTPAPEIPGATAAKTRAARDNNKSPPGSTVQQPEQEEEHSENMSVFEEVAATSRRVYGSFLKSVGMAINLVQEAWGLRAQANSGSSEL